MIILNILAFYMLVAVGAYLYVALEHFKDNYELYWEVLNG